jgi:hypothetical protein
MASPQEKDVIIRTSAVERLCEAILENRVVLAPHVFDQGRYDRVGYDILVLPPETINRP